MKTLFTTLIAFNFCCLPTISNAQEEKLVFSYDSRGNLIERKIKVFPLFRLSNLDRQTDSISTPLVKPLNIFPNPSNDMLVVEGELPENVKRAEITLSNLIGQVLFRDFYTGDPKIIPVIDLGNGIYILSFRYSQKETFSYKIVVAH